MLLYKPAYFDRFRCIAGDCPDSCCKEWEVQVDKASAEFYRSLTGPLGERLRQVLRQEEGETLMTITDGRCPMWESDGLCRIQRELGEGALCRTCREFPRLTHDYGDFVELGLEMSCPEAAKWILDCDTSSMICAEVPGGEAPEYDEEAMALLKASRQTMLDLLSDPIRPVPQILALALLYGCQAQSELDSGDCQPFDEKSSLEEAAHLAAPGSIQDLLDFFLGLELLTPQWEALLRAPVPGPWERGHLALARYLVQRYWLQAVSDYDLYSRVKLTVVACLLVRQLGGRLLETAQLFSKEIENSIDNLEAILDATYSHPAFRDDRLLSLLLTE